MEVQMKTLVLALGTLALIGHTAFAADTAMPVAAAVDANAACAPGMTAATPDVCSLPGFHWQYTTVYFGRHADSRQEWMLLPNK
jgi:hypothetical protein